MMLCFFHTEYQSLAERYFKSVSQNPLKFFFFLELEFSILEFKHFIDLTMKVSLK